MSVSVVFAGTSTGGAAAADAEMRDAAEAAAPAETAARLVEKVKAVRGRTLIVLLLLLVLLPSLMQIQRLLLMSASAAAGVVLCVYVIHLL